MDKCPSCNSEYVLEEKKYQDYKICYECYNVITIPWDKCCRTPELEMVTKEIQGGGVTVRNQCTNCGALVGTALPQKSLLLDEINPINETLTQEYFLNKNEEFSKLQVEIDQLKRGDFWTQYKEYLESDKWKGKREKVLERDGRQCQACLDNPANEVHHLTYKHLYNEPLFELVSVCKLCHDHITKLDREKTPKALWPPQLSEVK